jgi:ribosomal protein L7/L12
MEEMKIENGYVVTEEERPYAEIINNGAMLQAVKEYREATGVGLKEAKDYIDGLAERMGKKHESKGGCFSTMLLLIVGITALIMNL